MKMYNVIKRCEYYSKSIKDFVRYLSSSEISTALRPFYFAVHPDLFGQHPNQREVNENSLKQLSSFITAVQTKKPIKPMIVPFYVRKKRNRGTFNLINIQLKSKDTRELILTILKACDLPTTFVNQLPPPTRSVKTDRITENYKSDSSYVHDIFADIQIKIKKKSEETTLKNWLNKNSELAKERTDAEQPIVEEINRLKQSLTEILQLKAIKWECGWNISHFRGCLEAFQSLSKHYPETLKHLKGRTIVFAPFTGVSLEGDVLLNTGDVRHNWLDLIRNVTSYDLLLTKIPSFEKAVSQVLLNIKIGRRKFMPKIMVAEYEKHLVTITTTLNDYKGLYKYPKHWPKSLEEFEIVIETEAGPLTLSPTGQFIVPSSCPGFLLIDFISENLEEAKKRLEEYSRHKELEKELYNLVKKELKLNGLHKDDAITPELMIACCNRLLENKNDLQNFNNLNLNITTYYSVLTNGVLCIPWNWIF